MQPLDYQSGFTPGKSPADSGQRGQVDKRPPAQRVAVSRRERTQACYGRVGMTIYKLRLFDAGGRIAAVQRLSAATDKEALSIVRVMLKEASAVAKFDLWQGERRIEGAAPTMRKGKPRH